MSDLDVRRILSTALPPDLDGVGDQPRDLVSGALRRAARHRRRTAAGSTAAAVVAAAAVVVGAVWLTNPRVAVREAGPAAKPSALTTQSASTSPTADPASFAPAVIATLGPGYAVRGDKVTMSVPNPASALAWDDMQLVKGRQVSTLGFEVERWPQAMIDAEKTHAGCTAGLDPATPCSWHQVGEYAVVVIGAPASLSGALVVVIRPDRLVVQGQVAVAGSSVPKRVLLDAAGLQALLLSEHVQSQTTVVGQLLARAATTPTRSQPVLVPGGSGTPATVR